jgi:hypothetical protein
MDEGENVSPVRFAMSKAFPPTGTPAATFTANGEQTLLCQDDATCDLTEPIFEAPGTFVQHVAVGLTGGGENEVIDVTACDSTGDCRTVQVIFVETFLVVPPLTETSADAPALVSYRCDDIGRYTGKAADSIARPGLGLAMASPEVTWEEVFDWFAFGFVQSGALRSPVTPTLALRMDDIPFFSCGGDTGSRVNAWVSFETDFGMLSVDSMGDVGSLAAALVPGNPLYRPFGSVTPGCDVGHSVDIRDHPGPVADTRGFPVPVGALPADWCDLDFAPNGVITYALWGTGEPGAATITARQSGGSGVSRSSGLSLTGLPTVSLFLEAPNVIGVGGGEFSLGVVDGSLRPLGGQTVRCAAEPKDAVLAIIPQTGTTGGPESDDPGRVRFTVFPARSAARTRVELKLTCLVDSNPDVSASVAVRIGMPEESVVLRPGCNFVTWTGDEIDPIDLGRLVDPMENLAALWAQQPSPEWKGFAPEFPEASNMRPLKRLDIVAVCATGMARFARPTP